MGEIIDEVIKGIEDVWYILLTVLIIVAYLLSWMIPLLIGTILGLVIIDSLFDVLK